MQLALAELGVARALWVFGYADAEGLERLERSLQPFVIRFIISGRYVNQ